MANEVRFGLSASICTRNLSHALEYVQRAEAGVIIVNLPSAGIEYQIPFGGLKDSSFGPREQGPAAMQFYTETKTVYAKYRSGSAFSGHRERAVPSGARARGRALAAKGDEDTLHLGDVDPQRTGAPRGGSRIELQRRHHPPEHFFQGAGSEPRLSSRLLRDAAAGGRA